MKKQFPFSGRVQRFRQVGGWYFVAIAERYTELGTSTPAWGQVPVELVVGKTRWRSSLMPMGDGSLFIALPARVRKAEGLIEGGPVSGIYAIAHI